MILKHLNSLPSERVSHDPEIVKQVFLKNGEVPHLTNLSTAVLTPGQKTAAHAHKDMWEVFLVTEGEGTAEIDGREHSLSVGACLVIAPGEMHVLRNDHSSTDLRFLYFGVV